MGEVNREREEAYYYIERGAAVVDATIGTPSSLEAKQ